ncbi:MAG: PAS domain S-box protein [Ignavibacteria bacterium]|jgi:PAS domain S-box-containing protein
MNNKFNIFIVEDDWGLANLVKRYLNRENIEAEIFISGNVALQEIANNPPALILLDYKLSDCSVQYFIEHLKQINENIEFIVMTGFGDEKLAVEMMKLGAIDYLIKDESFQQLIVPVIKQALEKVKLKNELLLSEAALRESEAEKRIILETVSELVVYYNTNLEIQWANPAFMNYFAKVNDKIVGCYCCDVWQNACIEKFECLLKKTIENGTTNTFERKTYDGKIWVANCYPIQENNEIIGAVETAIDITERKRAEEALKRSEENYRIIIENQTDLVVKIDTEGNFLFVSPSYCETFGKSKNELVNKKSIPLIHEDDLEATLEEMKKLYKPPYVCDFEQRVLTKNGWRWFAWSNTAVLDENNEVKEIIGVGRDITERKNFENELIKKEHDYRGLFENAHDAIIVFEPENEIVLDVNNRALELYGFSRGELIGMSIKSISKDIQRGERQVKITLERGSFYNFITTQYKKSGEEMVLEINASVIDYKGRRAILSINRDITERIKTEKVKQTLFNISNSSNNSRNINELITGIRTHLNEIISADNLFVALYQKETETLRIQYQKDEYDDQVEIPAEKTLSKYVIDTQKSLFADFSKIQQLVKKGEVKLVGQPAKQWLGVPLWYENTVVGVLAVQSYSDDEEFSENDLKLLEFTSEHISVALIRKQSEEALKESERKYREIFNSTSDAIFIHDAKTSEIVDINKSVEVITGYTREEIFNEKNIDYLLKKHFRNAYRQLFVNFRRATNEGIRNLILPAYKKNGEKVWLDIIFKATEIGGEKRVLTVSRDITERKLAIEELEKYKNELEVLVENRTEELLTVNYRLKEEIEKQKKSELKVQNQVSFLRSLVDTIPIPIFIKDKSKKYINCNKSFEELIGKSKEQIIGKTSFEVISLQDAVTAEEIDEQLLSKPGNIVREGQLGKENKTKTLITFYTTFHDHNNKVAGIIGAILDITQQKEMEKQLKVSLEKEKELNQLKSRFISTASHEFRTPLTAILSSIDLLDINRKKDNMERYYIHIDKMKKSIYYMTELLDDVLTINRTETGKLEFKPEYFDLNKYVKEIFEENKSISESSHEMILKFNKDIREIYADKKIIKLIFSNLLSNAIKYSPNGGKILTELNVNGNELLITVSDEGCGIPENDQVNLFEPFFRAGNVDNILGTGLGLSIVKRSVELHNGTITFESKENYGTTFKVNLPIGKFIE